MMVKCDFPGCYVSAILLGDNLDQSMSSTEGGKLIPYFADWFSCLQAFLKERQLRCCKLYIKRLKDVLSRFWTVKENWDGVSTLLLYEEGYFSCLQAFRKCF